MPSDEIFGKQVGEHPPDDADRAAGVDHILEQPQHLVEHQQHRREHQRADQRHRDRAREIAVDQADSWRKFGRPSTMIWPQRQPTLPSGRMHPGCRGVSARDAYSEPVREIMSKALPRPSALDARRAARRRAGVQRPRPCSRGRASPCCPTPNRPATSPQLPRIREYCADHPDVFHYEVEHAHQIGEAMKIDRPRAAQGAGDQRRRRHRPGGADRALQRRAFRRRAAAGRGAAERQDQPHRARPRRARRPDRRRSSG